jgi:acyl dehydratase
MLSISYSDLITSAGTELGESREFLVDQPRITAFAVLTEDHQWIHVDALAAAKGPFGTTIAHGYLTLSLVAPVIQDLFEVRNYSYAVNYGLNRVRFPSPLLSGSRVRGIGRISEVRPVTQGIEVVLDIRLVPIGLSKPACVAESVLRYYDNQDGVH